MSALARLATVGDGGAVTRLINDGETDAADVERLTVDDDELGAGGATDSARVVELCESAGDAGLSLSETNDSAIKPSSTIDYEASTKTKNTVG